MTKTTPVKGTKRLDALWIRGTDFLGTDLPILCGAMTWISDPKLVSLVSNLGGFGILAAGNMPPDLFANYVKETRELTRKPFAGNVITIAPNYKEHLRILCDQKATHIVFAGSLPRAAEIKIAKKSGAKVICFASTASMAKRLIEWGTDALILEGSEAGGHVGHVSTIVLLQEILFTHPDLPIFIAGGIATGKMIGHLILMGASGVQLGTRFVMAEECGAHPNFKEVFIRARAREAVSTPQYSSKLPVVAVRALKNAAMERFGELQMELLKKLAEETISRHEAQIQVEQYWAGTLREAAVNGDIENGSLMAGQSVGLVKKVQPMREILEELVADADRAVQDVSRLLKRAH